MSEWLDKFEKADKKWTSWQMQEYEQADRVLPIILEDKARRLPDHVIFQFAEEVITFEQLHLRTNQLANGFLSQSIGCDSKVAVMLPNIPEHLYCWFGLNKLGAIDVPINVALRGSGLAHQINQGDCVGLVVFDGYLEHIENIIDRLSGLRFVVVVSANGAVKTLPHWGGLDISGYAEFADQSMATPEPQASFKDQSTILFTSGTTGPSKGVIISHNYWYQSAVAYVKSCRLTEDDVMLTAMPFFHSAARGMTVLPAILTESKAVFSERFSASGFFDEARKYGCTTANYIGGMVSMLMKQEPRDDDADNPLRLMVGAAAPENLWEPFQQRFSTRLLELYGLTEALFNLINPWDDRRPGSCGKPINGYRVKVVDENDNEVPPGVVGEIIVQPESMYLGTSGYYKMPEKTLELVNNFWYHTGDLAKRDEDGYFYYSDRKKQSIRRRGENISSFEVEAVINEHPDVLESCVVGVPSELGEEDVKAVIVIKGDVDLQHKDVIEWCSGRLAYFCIPRYVAFRDGLPKTPSERVEKYKLKNEGVTDDCWDLEKSDIKLKK